MRHSVENVSHCIPFAVQVRPTMVSGSAVSGTASVLCSGPTGLRTSVPGDSDMPVARDDLCMLKAISTTENGSMIALVATVSTST